MGCGRRSSLILLALFLVSSSLWAFPGHGAGEAAAQPEITIGAQTQEAESQRNGSGEASKQMSEEPKSSPQDLLTMAQEKVDGSAVIVAGGKTELQFVLEELGSSLHVAEEASKAKDEEISELKRDLAEAEKATGTKAYLMLEGIMGFEFGVPQFGTGLTLGTRIGNHLMVELGADYMIGGMDGYNQFSLDNFEFRCGIGWMF